MTELGKRIIHPEGGSSYAVDFSAFERGGSTKLGDFTGRPGLAAGLHYALTTLGLKEQSAKRHCLSMRHLLRHLDDYDPEHRIAQFDDFTDADGLPLYRAMEGTDRYGPVKGLIDAWRRSKGLRAILWPPGPIKPPKEGKDIDLQAVKKLYLAFKGEARDIRAMFDRGESLAERGRDQYPRDPSFDQEAHEASILKALTSEMVPSLSKLQDQARGLELSADGPAYQAPAMRSVGVKAYSRQLRWFYPSLNDTCVMLWLFLIRTGWNMSTALSIDVSTRDAWLQEHPLKGHMVILRGHKARSGRDQSALSATEPIDHPYKIVEYMIQRTTPLRRALQSELDDLNINGRRDPDFILRRVELEAAVKSPWLYHSLVRPGQAARMVDINADAMNEVVRAVMRKHGLVEQYPNIGSLTTRDTRQAWIGHAHIRSGRNGLITRLAAQHSNDASLRHYLHRPGFRKKNEEGIRAVHNAIFGEVASGRPLDPTRLRLIATHGEITPEQEARLRDARQRTRLGMGCLEPTKPPRAVAPDHVEGELCRVQRCTGCRHGVVFEESLDALVKAHVKLIRTKARIPIAAWIGSSFEDEERSISETLLGFDQQKVRDRTGFWAERLEEEVDFDDVYPTY